MTFVFLTLAGATFAFTGLTKAKAEVRPATPVTAPTTTGHSTGGVKAEAGDLAMKLDFNAHSNPKGQVNYSDSSGTKFKGKVDMCYSQSGNEAIFAGTVNKGNVSEKYFIVAVQDNEQGKNSDPDMVGVVLTDVIPTCVWDNSFLTAEVQNGNLVVH